MSSYSESSQCSSPTVFSENHSSTTSLSSLALSSTSEPAETDAPPLDPPLIDTYGNVFELPDYTIKEIRNAIPAHCYERSAVKSLAYLSRDFIFLASTFYLFNRFVTPEKIPYTFLRTLLWFVYTFVQGLFGTGVWVMAHECGHQAFSPYRLLNDTVGWLSHSFLLVPYFSWKITHGKHHKATGNMHRDMVFVPQTRPNYANRIEKLVDELAELMEETPILTAFNLFSQQLFGWPMYLLTNVTGHTKHEQVAGERGHGKYNGFLGGVNHFWWQGPIFALHEAKYVMLSNFGLLIMGFVLAWIGINYGWANLAIWYICPYLWVNHWLVAITFLQHTDPSLPHYMPDAWTYTRGAAATIDREFGFIGRHLMHGIIETHVLHHYVSTIPFYNADEASEAIKKVMGRHYHSDTKDGSIGFIKSLWKTARWCNWVEPCEGVSGEKRGVLFFRNRNGLGVPPAKTFRTCQKRD